jgi:hypothetical protein
VAVPAWSAFMKKATAGDGADWFPQPADVEKVTVCRTSGLLATDACRHGWTGIDTVQAGLIEVPGEAVGTTGRKPAARTSASTVYDDYFPIGSAPTEPCPIHGAQTLPGASATDAATDILSSFSPAPGTSASPVPVSYRTAATPTVQRVVGADGRLTYVIRNQ